MLTALQISKLSAEIVHGLRLHEPDHRLSRSQWFETGGRGRHGIKLYLRRGYHVLNDAGRWCIDVASAEATRPGNGSFTAALGEIERLADRFGLYVYLENVIAEDAERLCAFYERRGYVKVTESFPACYYRTPA